MDSSYLALLAAVSSFLITFLSIPPIIRLSLVKRLYDRPDERKNHPHRTSALGGVGIFGGMIFSFLFFTAGIPYPELNSILCALIVLFVTGVKDDLYPMVPGKKLIGQLVAALIVSMHGGVRIKSIYGLLGVYEIPYVISIGVTVFVLLFLINAFNFIDGINGLTAGIGIIGSATYAWWFWRMNEPLFLILGTCMVGAQAAFLWYNVRGRIFMGDSGSMVIGFLLAVLTVYFIKVSEDFKPNIFYNISAVAYAVAVLIVPVFDALRIVFIRLVVHRKSPFRADRNHIHHLLIGAGLKHWEATLALSGFNMLMISLAWYFNGRLLPKYQLVVYLVICLIFTGILLRYYRKKNIAVEDR
ncbi:glycosyltransferase family 4 protein [Schleiferia thermophila]|uniref:glycosyltransferase family 4 protein n=1 Tax=Schleiferia thermophila TaxID=884107 RepID=UPI0004E7ACC6|nr:MraY family glycosyltransferase [Schleiferia thermophila]KFD39346.1 glycosyl transferase family 4 [Schleiferia thermophila str. Yellowstone]